MQTIRLAIFHCCAIHYIEAFLEKLLPELELRHGAQQIEKTVITCYANQDSFLAAGYDDVIHYPYRKHFSVDHTPDSFFTEVNDRKFDYLIYFCDKQLPYPQSNLRPFIEKFNARNFIPFNTKGYRIELPEVIRTQLTAFGDRPLDNLPSPRAVAICTTDFCSADCSFCCLKTQGVQPHDNILSFADFKRYYPQVLEQVDHIDFSLGEIFTNPEAGLILDYVIDHYPEKKISIYTNAIGLKETFAEQILAAPQDFELDISINATTAETYRKEMQVDAFKRVLENIDYLTRRRAELGLEKSKKVVFSYLISNASLEEYPAVLDLIERYRIDGLIPRIMKIYDKQSYAKSVYFNQQRYNDLVAQVETEAAKRGLNFSRAPRFSGNLRLTPLDRSLGTQIKCDSPWALLYLRTNGDVSLCANWNFHIGNIRRQSFAEIWNGERARKVRQDIIHGDNPRECWACECNFAEENWIDSLAYHFVWGFQEHLMDVRFNDDYGYRKPGDFNA